MNDFDREHPLESVVDRIVDGSLSPAELRQALSRLDRESDGWKRCTLAFVEAQCWHEAFRALDAPSIAGPRPDLELRSVRPSPAKFARSRARWWRGAAAAAVVAASFALGWLSHFSGLRDRSAPARSASPPLAVTERRPDLADEPVVSASLDPRQPIRSDGPFAVDHSAPSPGELVQAVAQVRIGSEGAEATVPILAGPGINGDWLSAQPPPLSEYEQVVLQRHGYHVDQRRRLLVATLADGRRVSLPIDQVEIRYTGINPL